MNTIQSTAVRSVATGTNVFGILFNVNKTFDQRMKAALFMLLLQCQYLSSQ